MKAIHAVNAALWQPGEQIENNDKQTDYYTRGRPRALRVIIVGLLSQHISWGLYEVSTIISQIIAHNYKDGITVLSTHTCIALLEKVSTVP